ncbi:MAG: DUF3623 family protein [Roseiflexus sp.]
MLLSCAPFVYVVLVLSVAVVLPAIADRLSSGAFSWSYGMATVAVVGALVALAWIRDDLSLRGVYMAHLCAMVVWIWLEIGCRVYVRAGMRRLGFARRSALWQEIAWVFPAAGIVALTWGGANQWGVGAFLLAWCGHLSMRLTAYAASHARDGGPLFWPPWFAVGLPPAQVLSAIFPLSVTALTSVCVWFVADALVYGLNTSAGVGAALLAAQSAVAVVALWLDVLPANVWVRRVAQMWRGAHVSPTPQPLRDV